MKTKSRLLALLAGVVLTASPVYGQKATRSVSIDPSNPSPPDFEQQVISGLNARLGATTRFSMTEVLKAELIISLMCLDMNALGLHNVKGGVCSYTITYYPQELAGLSTVTIGPAIASGSEPFEIAEPIFQKFVKVSTEDKLKKHLESLHSSVRLYEANKLAKAKP